MKIKKTNAMRILDQNKIDYTMLHYEKDLIEKGIPVYDQIHKSSDEVFKTIVLHHDHDLYVAVIPILKHLDLKKTAKAFGVKRLELFPLKDLFNKTGYVRGGCTALGMRKIFPTIYDKSALELDEIVVSAGKVGTQMSVNAQSMAKILKADFADLCQ